MKKQTTKKIEYASPHAAFKAPTFQKFILKGKTQKEIAEHILVMRLLESHCRDQRHDAQLELERRQSRKFATEVKKLKNKTGCFEIPVKETALVVRYDIKKNVLISVQLLAAQR